MSACLQVKYFCNETGVECSVCRYHCVTMPDVDLSPAAYADGKFPPGCSSKDFVRIDQADFQVISHLSACNSSTCRGIRTNLSRCCTSARHMYYSPVALLLHVNAQTWAP